MKETGEQALAHAKRYPAIITPSMPERAALLAEAAESVKRQTVPCVHHVLLDPPYYRRGPAILRNTGIENTECEFVGFLDDDDLLDPDHVQVLTNALFNTAADLAFSWYRREGSTPTTERIHVWDDYAYGVMLGGRNLIPVTVMARREAVLDAGAFRPEDRWEDYSLWMRMLANGARFVVVPRETWTYRMLGDNRTNLPA